MARKISTTKTSDNPVKTAVIFVLESAEILKCKVERYLPRSKAPRGKIESKPSLTIRVAEENGVSGVVDLSSFVLKGENSAPTNEKSDPFAISFEMEGFYRSKNRQFS